MLRLGGHHPQSFSLRRSGVRGAQEGPFLRRFWKMQTLPVRGAGSGSRQMRLHPHDMQLPLSQTLADPQPVFAQDLG